MQRAAGPRLDSRRASTIGHADLAVLVVPGGRRPRAGWLLDHVQVPGQIVRLRRAVGILAGYQLVGTVRLPAGSSGTSFGCGEVQKTGTSKHELKMHGAVRVEQTIERLHPGTAYQLSAWVKAAGDRSAVVLGVRGYGGPERTVTSQDQGWERKTLDFTTGEDATAGIVFIEQTAPDGEAYADNLGLPRSPAAKD